MLLYLYSTQNKFYIASAEHEDHEFAPEDFVLFEGFRLKKWKERKQGEWIMNLTSRQAIIEGFYKNYPDVPLFPSERFTFNSI